MRNIYLPNLQKIRIQNFSLYPNGLDFTYDFVNGVNLIIGGNGMGKTTLVNIIKYSIIGHYKKSFDFRRTYLYRAIEGRQPLPKDYYKNRQDDSINLAEKANVTIEFKLNDDFFVVTRCLEEINLLSVSVNNKPLKGEIINQYKFDKLDDDNKEKYLLGKYENSIANSAGITFDDLIFFVNEILFFGEEHNTILWNDDLPNVQEELFNKYFTAPELDLARKEATRKEKYFDSVSRHKSEDMRAINKVLKNINDTTSSEGAQSINARLLDLRNLLDKLNREIDSKQSERAKVDDQIKLLDHRINQQTEKETELEEQRKSVERNKLQGKWMILNKNYDVYFQSIKLNEICPLCNQELTVDFVEEKIALSENCCLCSQKIVATNTAGLDKKATNLRKKINDNYQKIVNDQRQISEKENEIKKLDEEFRSLLTKRRETESEIRRLESAGQSSSVNELQAFFDEIEKLRKEKDLFAKKSKNEQDKASKISSTIEDQIRKNTSKFSEYFSEFAGKFLGVSCSLTFDEQSGVGSKRFYPVIDGTIRYSEDELSESQRFFVDHAFRMSILSFFYTKASFYIVETPNSSLDISYEKNAADVFAAFLKKPQSLIITTNLNNSEFLTHLIDAAKKVSYINLLEIGKKSKIQSASKAMRSISNRITRKINQ